MIKVLIIDDHQLFIDGLVSSFKNDDLIDIVGFALDGRSGILQIITKKPDVIILDINFSLTKEDGVDILKDVKKLDMGIRTLVLTSYCDVPLVEHLREEGAEGFRVKNIGIDELKKTIIDIHKGEIVYKYNADLMENTVPFVSSKLSDRALQIIKLLTEGYIVKEIAEKLGISDTTVNDHIERTRRKLNAKNNSELVFIAMKNRLI